MNWNEMTPEQRNQFVAEKVMGWEPKPCNLDETDQEMTIYSDGEAWCPCCHVRDHINSFVHGIIPPPSYTQSLDLACYAISQLLKARGGFCKVAFYSKGHADVYLEPGRNFYEASANTLIDALCFAALKSVGVEIEE